MSLKDIRLERGMTQAEVADQLHITASAFSLIENGKRGMMITRAKELADLYGISVDELLGRTGGRNDRNPEVAAQKDERHPNP